MMPPSQPGETIRNGSKERLFARSVLLLGAAGALTVCFLTAFGGQGTVVPPARRLLFAGGSLLLATALLAALRLPQNARTGLAVTLLSLVTAAYFAELYLRWETTQDLWSVARRLGLPYDDRQRVEVVRDLRSAGQDAWPVPFPIYLLGHADTRGLLPLGGVSGVPTVLCNEVGSYVTYRSDERGFRNPPGMWSVDGLQLAAVGDSYTQGMCVKDHESAIDLIRVAYPRTLNLGMSGDGPLLELATLKEYLPELRPPRVLWFYFEGNDLVLDLDMERKSRSLTAYLKPGHRQNLGGRQEEVDGILRDFLAKGYERAAEELREKKAAARFWPEFLTLRTFRRSLGLLLPAKHSAPLEVDDGLFRQILEEASRTVSGWRGRLYFVYLPGQARYHDEETRRGIDAVREKVLSIVRDLGISLIDLQPVFRTHKISSLYVRPPGHLNSEGYRLVAKTILEVLSKEEKRAGGATSGPSSRNAGGSSSSPSDDSLSCADRSSPPAPSAGAAPGSPSG
ncbi:MAG: hypothetical protein DMH00_05560 [Acidobacteria bacterium]|nr:MAG: hypothetical protein DMH00_05560 [Acidobacteriota bacterium]